MSDQTDSDARSEAADPSTEEPNDPDERQPAKRARPEPIAETLQNVAAALMTSAPREPQDWRYQDRLARLAAAPELIADDLNAAINGALNAVGPALVPANIAHKRIDAGIAAAVATISDHLVGAHTLAQQHAAVRA